MHTNMIIMRMTNMDSPTPRPIAKDSVCFSGVTVIAE